MAHELGHIELNHKLKNISSTQQEKEADQFAKYLLEDNSIQHLLFPLVLSVCILLCFYVTFLSVVDTKVPDSTSVITGVSVYSTTNHDYI